jgi:hypothetical protein
MMRLDADSGEVDGSPERDVGDVLQAWRRQERLLGRLTPGTAEHERVEAETGRLRTEYQRLVSARLEETSETSGDPLD